MKIDRIRTALNFIKKNNKPTFHNVLVRQDGIFATDFETSVHVKDCYGLKEGLHDIVTFGWSRVEVADINEYIIPLVNSEINNTSVIKVKQLEHLLKHASKDETRLYLNGVCFQSGVTVATNSHTLKHIESNKFVDDDQSYTIPRSSIVTLLKFLKGFKLHKDNVSIAFNDDYAVVDNDKFKITMRLIQREFPKWRNVVPKTYKHSVTITNWIDYKHYKKTLHGKNNKVVLKGGGGLIWICGGDENNEEGIGYYDSDLHDEFEIGFNCEYLDIASEGKKQFDIRFNNEYNSVLVNGVIVMPLKL